MSEVQVFSKRVKITLDNFKATKNGPLFEGEEFELTDRHKDLIAECIMQTLYNLGIASDADIDYTMTIEGGTTYHTIAKDGDVMVHPIDGQAYRRRIRNDRNIFKKKDDYEGQIELPR